MFFTRKPTRTPSSSSSSCSSMAPSLSSLLLPNSNPTSSFPFSSQYPNPYLIRRKQYLNFSVKSSSSNNNNNKITYPPPQQTLPPEENKRSFAVATGELFLGIASRLLKSNSKKKDRSFSINGVSLFDKRKQSGECVEEDEEKIGAVMEDEIEPDVIWEQRVKDIEAEKERLVVTSPGFSFSAAGLLFPYHLGVSQFLLEKGYIKETTPLAGSSAGSIICAVIASGASMQEALDATKILAKDCREKGTAFRLGAVLREVLENFLPEDVHIKSNGRVRIAVTQISWRPKGLLVDQFDSREDLINALITSSFIPGYLAPRPATLFRNRLCVDGGLAFFMPPTSASRTVRVCAFAVDQLGLEGIEISPHLNPENRISPRVLFNWALEPADDDILDRLFELGYLDAAAWAQENPVDEIVRDDSPSEESSS